MKSSFLCGAARCEITADPSWYPLMGFFFSGDDDPGSYQYASLDPQFARAIAVRNDDTTVLLVSMDLIGVPDGAGMTARIAEETGVDPQHIFMIATHTHNVPAIGHGGKLAGEKRFQEFQKKHPDIAAHQLLYEQRVWDGLVNAAKGAIASLRPATMGIGYSKSYVNINRDQLFAGKWGMGWNPDGHTDKTLALIRFADENGETIAVFVNYAVHPIVMFLNRCVDGKPGSTADLAGVTCNSYETQHPGTVCMWSPAANGNQNPVIMTYYGYPDPADGHVVENAVEGGAYEYLTVLAGRHYADVLRAEESIDHYVSKIELRAERKLQTVPADPAKPPRFPRPDADPNVEEIYTSGLMLGNIFLYGIGGELYSDIGAKLKELSPYRHTLICSQCYRSVGYMMDDKDLLAPTLFAARMRWVPNTLVPMLIRYMREFTD